MFQIWSILNFSLRFKEFSGLHVTLYSMSVNQRRQFYKLLKAFIVSHDIFLDRHCKNLLSMIGITLQ